MSATAERSSLSKLVLCALSVYTMFLVWGLLQEKSACQAASSQLTTRSYQHDLPDGRRRVRPVLGGRAL